MTQQTMSEREWQCEVLIQRSRGWEQYPVLIAQSLLTKDEARAELQKMRAQDRSDWLSVGIPLSTLPPRRARNLRTGEIIR